MIEILRCSSIWSMEFSWWNHLKRTVSALWHWRSLHCPSDMCTKSLNREKLSTSMKLSTMIDHHMETNFRYGAAQKIGILTVAAIFVPPLLHFWLLAISKELIDECACVRLSGGGFEVLQEIPYFGSVEDRCCHITLLEVGRILRAGNQCTLRGRGERGRHQNPFIHQPLGPTKLRNRQPYLRTSRAQGSQARRAVVPWLTRDQRAHRPPWLWTRRTRCYSNWRRSQVRKIRFSARWAIMVQKLTVIITNSNNILPQISNRSMMTFSLSWRR